GLQVARLPCPWNRDLPGEVAAGAAPRHVDAVPDLVGQVGRHKVHVVHQVLPRAGGARALHLAAEAALRADLAAEPGELAGEPVEHVHQAVHGVPELHYLSTGIDGRLAGEVAAGDRGRHFRDVAELTGQVAGD